MPTARKTTTTDTIPGEIVQQKDWASEPIERVLIEARRRIGAVRKSERNAHFNFHFRGIDNVVNAAVPVFNDLGVLVTPVVKELSARGGNAIVWVDYWFHGPKGDTLVVPMVGEQSDTTKALSIAWRTALRHPGRSALIVALVALPTIGLAAGTVLIASTVPT